MIALAILMLLVAVCAGVLQYHTETEAMQQLLQRQNKKNFQILHAAVIEPIISEDIPVLDGFIEMLLKQDQDLFSIEIFNANSQLLSSWQRSTQLPDRPLMKFSDKISLQGQVFGELRVSWSVDHFFQLIEQKIFQTQIFLAITLLIITLMVMLLLMKLIVKPIKQISRHVSYFLNAGNKKHHRQVLKSLELNQLDISVSILGKAFKRQVFVENELRKTKYEIETLSRRNDLILSSAGEGIFVVDSKAVTIYVNPAATKMTGWESEDLIGKGLRCLLSKSDSISKNCQQCINLKAVPGDIKNCHIYESFMNGELHHVGHELFWHKNGTSFPVEYVSTPIIENDHLSGAVIIFKDISQRIIAEQQLKDSEALKQAMLSSSLDAIITIDQEGLICEFNRAAEIMFGRNKQDALGKEMVNMIIPQQYRQKHQQGFKHYLETQKSKVLRQRIDISALRATGEEFPIELVITPITLHGKTFFTAFISDITERQKDKKTIDDARKQAEKANTAKSQFLAAMSHEIRTPLNAIIGINDLLQTTELNPEQQGYVQIAEQSGFALREITNNILDFSKIEAGKLVLELQVTDIVDLIDSVILIMAPRAVEKNLDLVAIINYPIPEKILLDPVRIKQVLLNLVSNAIKFTENGGIVIQLEFEQTAQQTHALKISVIDSGIGIAKNSQHDLFDEFTQGDLTTTRKYGGTGLGLAIAKRLIVMSGGKIGVESTEGEGSQFWFCLNIDTEPDMSFNPIDINCWVFDRGTQGEKSAELFYKQLQPLVTRVQTLASWKGIGASSDKSNVIFFDESQLAYFSQQEIEQFLVEKQDCCSLVLLVNNYQKQTDPSWLKVFDERLVKPIAIKPFLAFLSSYGGAKKIKREMSVINDASAKLPILFGVGFHVLLVEDSVVNQLVIKAMLEKSGFNVEVASNGGEAVNKSGSQHYDVILMDLSMPMMGGVEATTHIRKAIGMNQQTPIIALTANAFKENRQQCYQVGMNGFLAKPITLASLYQEIKKYLPEQSESTVEGIEKAKKETEDGCIIDSVVLDVLKQETSRELFPSLIKVFLEQGEKRVICIETAIKDNDFKVLEDENHALKSESATFGASRLANLTTKINLLCKQKEEKQAFIEAVNIKQEWLKVCTEIEKYY